MEKENKHPQLELNSCSLVESHKLGPETGMQQHRETPYSILKRCESLASEVVQPHSVQVLKKRRRVSFAPDGELETMHTYEVMGGDSPTKSETVSEIESPPFLQQSHVQLFCIKQAVPVLEGSIISTAAVKGGSLSAGLQSSPDRSSTMDLTECSLSALECYTPAAISRYSSTSFQFIAPDDGLAWSPAQVGGETSELPSLADLADEDNLIARREGHGCVPPDGKSLSVDPSIVKGDLDRTASGSQATECLEDPIDTSMDLTDGVTFCLANTPVLNGREISQVDKTSDDLTMGYSKVWEKGSHPTWGSGVPGELSGFHTGMNSSSVLPALQAQRQRWGAVPGQDDTLNIDLEGNAREQMGEATWNHVYGRTASAGDSNKSMKLGGFRNDSSVMEENLMLRKGENVQCNMASQYSTSTDEISSQLHSSCTMALQPTHGNSTLKNAELEDESNIEEAAAVQLQCGQENVTLSLKQAQNQSMLILPDAKGQFSKKRNMQLLTTPKFDSNGTSHEPNTLLFTPTGILDPGHTTRLLDDSATNGHTSQVTKNLRNTTPQSFPVSDSLVPLTLSGASKSSGSERAPEDNGASANSNLADNTGLSIPSVEIVQAHSMSPEGSTLAQDNEQKLENAFEDAVGEDNNCLLSSGSPTKTLAEFGELPTPLKATIDIPGETSVVEQLPNKNTSGLEVLEGTFQSLSHQLQRLKSDIKSKKKSRQDRHESNTWKSQASTMRSRVLTSNMPVTVSDGSTKVFAGSLDKSSPAKSEESLKSLECQVDLYLPRTPPGLNILAFPASGARSSALTPHAKPPLGYTSETATLDNCEGRLDFVSFFNLADMGFSDRLRRGPSIDGASGLNLRADMPKGVLDAYELVYVTLVDVEEQEQRVKTLRLQITARTRSIANDEQAIQVTYPLVFSKLEHAADHELVRVKKSLCALKNICRARSQTHWKQWRVQREEELATTFMENYKVLQEDKQFALRNRQVRYNFVAASKAFSLLEKATLAKSRYGSKVRSRTIEEQSATKLRIQRLDQKAKGLETKVEELRKQVFVLGERRGVLSRRWSEAKKKAGLFVPGTTAHEVLGQETLLQLHQALSGWQIGSDVDSQQTGHFGGVNICNNSLGHLQLRFISPDSLSEKMTGVEGLLQVAPHNPALRHDTRFIALADRFLRTGSKGVLASNKNLLWRSPAHATLHIQEMFAVVSRLQCLLDELCEVRLLYPNLSNCHVKPDGSALELRFLDLSLKRFCAVEVKISSDYPASQPAVTAHVQFPSDQAVSEESTQKIAFGAARGYGQVGRICTIVSEALAID